MSKQELPEWLFDLTNDWGGFLLRVTEVSEENLKDTKFDFYFLKTSFNNEEEEELFFADEMQIKLHFKDEEDGEWYEGDTYYPELICGDDRDNNFESYIFYNTPNYEGIELVGGWSNSGEMTFEEAVIFLKNMKILNYDLLSEDEKNNFKYFSSSKLKKINSN